MSGFEPFAEPDTRYGHENATAGPWSAAKELLTRGGDVLAGHGPSGRPHVTPLIGVGGGVRAALQHGRVGTRGPESGRQPGRGTDHR